MSELLNNALARVLAVGNRDEALTVMVWLGRELFELEDTDENIEIGNTLSFYMEDLRKQIRQGVFK